LHNAEDEGGKDDGEEYEVSGLESHVVSCGGEPGLKPSLLVALIQRAKTRC
jgi:hypothetical protein